MNFEYLIQASQFLEYGTMLMEKRKDGSRTPYPGYFLKLH
jgi:hypothetical protein